MFNLLVSGNGTSWETDQLMRMGADRFKEYSGIEAENVSLADALTLRVLESVPSLLMYESGARGENTDIVRVGQLRDIRVVGSSISFRFVDEGHCDRDAIRDFATRLGIDQYEFNRTHWAIKDGDLPSGLRQRISWSPFGMQISELTRRRIVDVLTSPPRTFHGQMKYMDFLKRVWNLSSMPSTDSRFDDAEGDIWQHTVNNEDWSEEELLLDYLNLKGCSDAVFERFVEAAVNPRVGTPEEIDARVDEIDVALRTDGFRLAESHRISSRPVYSVTRAEPSSQLPKYEVVLSFAGEDRPYVAQVADFLRAASVAVFYDEYEEATLWGKDLTEHLLAVYGQDAKFCVMFISKRYAEKIWTNQERLAALAKSVTQREEYILPARFDDTALPGIRSSTVYVDLTRKSPSELGHLILQKLGRN